MLVSNGSQLPVGGSQLPVGGSKKPKDIGGTSRYSAIRSTGRIAWVGIAQPEGRDAAAAKMPENLIEFRSSATTRLESGISTSAHANRLPGARPDPERNS